MVGSDGQLLALKGTPTRASRCSSLQANFNVRVNELRHVAYERGDGIRGQKLASYDDADTAMNDRLRKSQG